MSVELDHTIVHAKDKRESAEFLSRILGLPRPQQMYHFLTVRLDNGVTLDYLETDSAVEVQHFAFLVSEEKFDEIFGRILEDGLPYWADPMHSQPNTINRNDGGRGVYFEDPSGHNLEIITRRYGSSGG